MLGDSVTLNIPSLPAVLAGPIMRRLTGISVAVWLAPSQGSDVALQVFEAALAAVCRSSILTGELAGSGREPELTRSKDATSVAEPVLAAGAGCRVACIQVGSWG
jgi:hypothetical protein